MIRWFWLLSLVLAERTFQNEESLLQGLEDASIEQEARSNRPFLPQLDL